VPQYREFNPELIDCQSSKLSKEMTWAEAVISLNEQLEKCVSSIELIINTINE